MDIINIHTFFFGQENIFFIAANKHKIASILFLLKIFKLLNIKIIYIPWKASVDYRRNEKSEWNCRGRVSHKKTQVFH